MHNASSAIEQWFNDQRTMHAFLPYHPSVFSKQIIDDTSNKKPEHQLRFFCLLDMWAFTYLMQASVFRQTTRKRSLQYGDIAMLKSKQQWQHKCHHDTNNDLQRQAHTNIIHKGISPSLHHKRIRRCGKRRGKTHAGAKRHRKQEWIRANTQLLRSHQSNRRHQHGRGSIADKHGHERSGEVNASQQSIRTKRTQAIDERFRHNLRNACLLQSSGHRHHGCYQHNALPVDGLIGGINATEATCKESKQSGDEHSRHRSQRDEVKHHHHNHQQHDDCRHRCLIVEQHLLGILVRMPQHNPVLILIVQLEDRLPITLNQQHITILQTVLAQLIRDALFITTNTQNIDGIILTQARVHDALTDQSGSGKHHNLGNAYIIEIQSRAVQIHQMIISRQSLHALLRTIEVNDVSLPDDTISPSHTLVHLLAKSLSLLIANLKNGESILVLQVQLLHSHASKTIHTRSHTIFIKIIPKLILLSQILETFALRLLMRLLLLLHQHDAHGQQHSQTYGNHNQPHRGKREKLQTCKAILLQCLTDHQVGRRTNQREHATKATRKRHRHQQTGRANARTRSHTHDDRHHDGHRTRIAHKCTYKRCGQHHKYEGIRLISLCQSSNLVACRLSQPRLKDCPSHNKQSQHHDDNGGRETAQRFFCGQNTRCSQHHKCRHSHNIATNTSPYKHVDSDNQHHNSYCHESFSFKLWCKGTNI